MEVSKIVEIDERDLNIVYQSSLSVCADCTIDDCGTCEIRKSQDAVYEILKERNI